MITGKEFKTAIKEINTASEDKKLILRSRLKSMLQGVVKQIKVYCYKNKTGGRQCACIADIELSNGVHRHILMYHYGGDRFRSITFNNQGPLLEVSCDSIAKGMLDMNWDYISRLSEDGTDSF